MKLQNSEKKEKQRPNKPDQCKKIDKYKRRYVKLKKTCNVLIHLGTNGGQRHSTQVQKRGIFIPACVNYGPFLLWGQEQAPMVPLLNEDPVGSGRPWAAPGSHRWGLGGFRGGEN